MMNGQPDLSLGVEHTAQVTPGHGKVWLSFNCLQVTSLEQVQSKNQEEEDGKGRQGRGCKRKTKRANKKEEKQKGQTK